MKKYLPFIKFTFSHTYYNDGKFRDSNLRIWNGRDKAEKNYHLILHQEEKNVFVLYIDCTNNFKERIYSLQEELKTSEIVSFLLETNNQYLDTFTKGLTIKAKNQLFKLHLPLTGNTTKLNYQLSDIEKTEGNTSFEKQIRKENPQAVLYITLDTINANHQLLQKQIEDQHPLEVNIKFEPKSFIWQYIFSPRNKVASDLSVVDSKQAINFSKIDWTEGILKNPEGIVQSEKEITIAESYPFKLQLWKNYMNGKKLLINHLAVPDPTHTGNVSTKNGNNYISIFQYF